MPYAIIAAAARYGDTLIPHYARLRLRCCRFAAIFTPAATPWRYVVSAIIIGVTRRHAGAMP